MNIPNTSSVEPMIPTSLQIATIDPKLLDIRQFESWREMQIANDEDEKVASNRLSLIRQHIKTLKQQRDYLTAPIKEAQKRITDLAAKALGPLEVFDKEIVNLLGDYMHQKRIRAEAEAKRVRDETAAQMKREAEAKLESAVKANSPVVLEEAAQTEQLANRIQNTEVKVRPQVRTEQGGSVGMMVTWDWEIFDAALVPREYLIVNEKKLNEIKRGYKTKPVAIPGVKFFEVTTPVVRPG